MNPDDLINQLNLESEITVLVIVGLAVALLLLINRKRLQARLREWRIQRNLDRIGCDQIRHLVCSDGLDGYFNIDRLALVRDSILLIVYKPYGGNIYCAERISEWTQLLGQKSFKFDNPLFEMENQLTSLRSLTGSANLEGYLFFSYSAVFPKGHPERVLHLDNIPERFIDVDFDSVKSETRATWDLLKAHQQQGLSVGQAGVRT